MTAAATVSAGCGCGELEFCPECFGVDADAYVLEDLPAEDYHADPCPVAPSLSQTIATEIEQRSALHGWALHPRLGGGAKPATQAKDDGNLVHRLLLGKGADLCAIDANDFRGLKARAQRDAAREAGQIPILQKKLDEASGAVEHIRERLANEGVSFDAGDTELSILWRSDTAEGPVWCRARLDAVQGRVIYDLKKSRDAHPDQAAKAVVTYGYDIQHAAYTEALERGRPELAGAVDFVFVFVELEPPYAVQVARLDGVFEQVGRARWGRAKEKWARCLREKQWPGYRSSLLEAPLWFLRKEGVE